MESIGVAEARKRLPELVARVAENRGDVVVIENRRRGGRVALLSEAYLRSLEAIVEETRKQTGEPFVLAGTMASTLSASELGEAVTALRRAQDAAGLGRLADLAQ